MAGPEGDLDWHLIDDELHRHFNELLGGMGMFLDGRVNYELMAEYWPTADADPASSEVERRFARIWRDMPKIVYSRTLRHADWNATVKHEVRADEVAELKAGDGGDLALGGADLATTFRRLDLIDEYRLYVHPIVLGRGKPTFGETDHRIGLDLAETRTFGNGVVLLRYLRG